MSMECHKSYAMTHYILIKCSQVLCLNISENNMRTMRFQDCPNIKCFTNVLATYHSFYIDENLKWKMKMSSCMLSFLFKFTINKWCVALLDSQICIFASQLNCVNLMVLSELETKCTATYLVSYCVFNWA